MVVKMKSASKTYNDEHYKQLAAYLSEALAVDSMVADKISKAFGVVTYVSGTGVNLMQESDVAIIYVLKGSAIYSINNEVCRFLIEGDFILNNCPNATKDVAFHHQLKINEPIVVAELNCGMLLVLRNVLPEIDKLISVLFNMEVSFFRNRIVEFQRMSAKDRMELFYTQYPEYAKRFKKYYVASYLGVQKETLSRFSKSYKDI